MHEDHVTFDQIVAFAASELDVAESRRVEAWLSLIPKAMRDLDRLRDVIHAMQADAASAPSPAAVRRALAAFASPTPVAPRWVQAARRLIAELLFDGRSQPMLAGYRGAAEGFQASYRTDAGRLDLQATPPDTGSASWRLLGQLALPADRTAGEVALMTADGNRPQELTRADAFGRFTLAPAPGVYDLMIELDGDEAFVAPHVEFGPNRA